VRDLFGDEIEVNDSDLLEDDLDAMVGPFPGETITDLIQAETGEGPPPARGKPWERYYDRCPYCGHRDSAAVSAALGAFRCHACGVARSTRWQASIYFAPPDPAGS
jgi:hypothetical protein